jgi:hypothetical protein
MWSPHGQTGKEERSDRKLFMMLTKQTIGHSELGEMQLGLVRSHRGRNGCGEQVDFDVSLCEEWKHILVAFNVLAGERWMKPEISTMTRRHSTTMLPHSLLKRRSVSVHKI